MPIYEYRCEKCGVVEVMQRITEAPLKKCPRCKSKVERMISSSSFVLKGSGWYATDYAKKGSTAPAAETANGTPPSTDSSSPSKTDSASKGDASSKSDTASKSTTSSTSSEKPAAKSSD